MKKIYMLLVVLIMFAAGCGGGGGGSSNSGNPSASSDKSITAFSIDGVAGTVDETNRTIAVNLPHGIDVTALVATFATTGAGVKVGLTDQVSGTTANNFTDPVIYTVTAADASTQDYTVTVTIVSASAKAITAFSINGVAGTIDETNKTIAVTLPYGTNVTALVATFTATGTSVKVGSTGQVSGTTANDFTNPVVYTVTAADATTQDYTVTIQLASSSSKDITRFSLKDVTGFINETNRTIAVTLPYGTNVTALVAKFTTTGAGVTVGSDVQVSGSTANDFTNPVVYTVTAADTTTKNYTVTVTVAKPGKQLYNYVINSVVGTIDESNGNIAVTLPYGTPVTVLKATFSTTGVSVTVGSDVQVSGSTANDFTNPVVYTVTAADTTTKKYTVTVTIAPQTYSISGKVSGDAVSGVDITLTGTGSSSTSTDQNGNYSFSGAANGDYTITASKTGYVFDPTSIKVTVDHADLTGQNFTSVSYATIPHKISGTVSGVVASGVTITLTGTGSNTTTTDSEGNFSFINAVNGGYTLTASLSGYVFSPASINVTVAGADVTGQNFTSAIDYTGSYSGTMTVSTYTGNILLVITSYTATSITGTVDDETFGYGERSFTSGYITGNEFYAEGNDVASNTTLTASGTFSPDGKTLSGTFSTTSGIGGTMVLTKE